MISGEVSLTLTASIRYTQVSYFTLITLPAFFRLCVCSLDFGRMPAFVHYLLLVWLLIMMDGKITGVVHATS